MIDINEIKDPSFLKDLSIKDLDEVAEEIRKFLIQSTSMTGGHIASNLGVVELTLALHYVFNSPKDKMIWDVGHQTYVHKILTGRAKQFPTLRQYKGLSGFPKLHESAHDVWETGHSSTSISAGVGFVFARDYSQEDYNVVSIIGDGSLTGGMAFEALNHLGHTNKKMIVILNDNEMSISKNVGSFTNLLGKMRTNKSYLSAKGVYNKFFNKPMFVKDMIERTKSSVKQFLLNENIFEDMGFTYFGPVNGHDIDDLILNLEFAKKIDGPTLVHVVTKKGKGFKYAEEDKIGKWHGVGKFNPETGEIYKNNKKNEVSWSKLISEGVLKLAKEDEQIVAITPAMINGSCLNNFLEQMPDRLIDVGIAEQHATTMAGGLAINGMKPFVAIYSSFLQRAYDQLNHDIARQNLNVVFGIDRAGLVGADGDTHQGIYDVSLMRHIPNMTIMMPKDGTEAWNMLYTAFYTHGPFAIRYPRGNTDFTFSTEHKFEKLAIGKWDYIRKGEDLVIISTGPNLDYLYGIVEKNNLNCDIINAKFIKPIDTELIDELIINNRKILVFEEVSEVGGINSAILEYCQKQNYNTKNIHAMAIPDRFIDHGSKDELFREIGLDEKAILDKINEILDEKIILVNA